MGDGKGMMKNGKWEMENGSLPAVAGWKMGARCWMTKKCYNKY